MSALLVVDDSRTYRHALALQLEADGHQVQLAESGAAGLAILATHDVECILLDLLMPGESGQEVCRRIKASPEWRGIPVIMLTGREDPDAIVESFNAGADDYVPKSSGFPVLRARLRAQIRRRQTEVEAHRMHEEVRRQADQLRALALELTQAEQRERKRVASILHDHLQQLLVAAQLQLGVLQSPDPAVRDRAAQSIRSSLAEAIAASRSLAVELSPPVLHQSGLAAALGWLSTWFGERNLLTVHVRADPRADPADENVRLLLFECVRELLLNAAKHAGVTEACLGMTRDDAWTRIEVQDQGRGFDSSVDPAGGRQGFGLFSIQQRLGHIGGRMEIETTPGGGTLAVLRAPHGRTADPDVEPEVVPEAPGRPGRDGRPITVLLVDDHEIIRQGLATLLELEPDLQVAGEAEDGETAVEFARLYAPDVVVMDVNLPGISGVEAARLITRHAPGTRVIGLSMHLGGDVADEMRRAGAVAFVTKGSPAGDLVAAIRAACAPPATP